MAIGLKKQSGFENILLADGPAYSLAFNPSLSDGIDSSSVELGQGQNVAGASPIVDPPFVQPLNSPYFSKTDANTSSLNTVGDPNPTLSVDAANPANVMITVSGLEADYSGTLSFTDATGQQDVVQIKGSGTYSADLTNLANGTVTYLLHVSDPAGQVINIDPTVTLGDGSANAPAGPAQLPNLLSSYAERPTWMVAGVDYAVGIPSGATLTPWYSLVGPGISVNTTTHVVTVRGISGASISNVDFSLDGGATLDFVNSPNAVVSNCNFGGANLSSILNGVISADQGSGGLTVEYCDINGDGAGTGSTLVSAGGTGAVTLEYNLLQNFPQHVLELTQSSGTNFSVVYKYNLIEQGAEQTAAHLNYIQFSSGTATSVNVEYNTSYQTPQTSGGEGYQFYDNSSGGSISNVTLAYNTMIAAGGAAGTAMSYLIHGGTGSSYTTPGSNFSAYDNFIADPAAWGTFYPGAVSGWSISNNVDMATGEIIQANNSEVAATTVTGVAASPSNGIEVPGNTIVFTVKLSQTVNVSGTPALNLNDGGTATYTGGSGTSALTFSYTVASTDTSETALAIAQVNLPNGATITDANGNTPNFAGAVTTFSGLQIDPPSSNPTINSIIESPSNGDLDAGKTVTLTLNTSGNVTVNTSGGIPTLTLNDGGTATYTGGSGTSALTFSYTVGAGQNTTALAATAINLNGGTIANSSGNAASLLLTGLTQTGPQIDTSAPTAPTSLVATTASSSQINLSWTASTDNVRVTGYEIFRNGTLVGTSTTDSYSDTGLTGSTPYTYTVEAYDGAGNLSTSSASASATTQAAAVWSNTSFAAQTGTFTATFDATPSQADADIVVGLSSTTAAAYTDLAAIVRFNDTGTIDVRDGSTYGADTSVTYTAGTSYQFAMVVDAATDTYSVYVTPQGGSQIALATNYSFRTEQATDTSLSDIAEYADVGSTTVQNFAIAPTLNSITPTVSSVTTSGTGITAGAGDLGAGKTVTFTLAMSEAVMVSTASGTPTLTLNDGGTASYTSGSGSSALTFSYTVGAGQNTASLAATAVNLNGGIIADGSGNAAALSLAGITQTGPEIDTTAPTIRTISETPSSGDLGAGKIVTYTITMSGPVTVNTTGGAPTLTFNDGGTATYVGGSGTNALTFSYTVLAGQNTPDLTVSTVNLSGATMQDGAGNAANLSVTGVAQGSPQIDTTAPTIASVAATGGDYNSGKVLTLTLNTSEAVNVTGTPTLALNDGGTATYTGGSGSSALTFSYTVAAGQNTAALQVTGLSGNVADLAGNVLSASNLPQTFAGVVIDATTPTVSSVSTSGTGITAGAGDLGAGKTVMFTVTMSEAVTVNTASGTPALALNDGGTAIYSGGSGTGALTFSYALAAGQNTSDLTVTAYNANGGAITNGAGTAATMTGAVTNPAGTLQIDTTTPTVSSLTTSGTGIAAGFGDLAVGSVVTLTVNLTEAVTVNTTGGTPTLTLNDGGTATYTGGSGSSALTFSYTVTAGQNTPDLTVTAYNANGGTITNGAGTAATMTGAVTNPAGTLQIDTTTPAVSSLTTSGTGITAGAGDLGAGKTVTFTIAMSEAVTVSTTGGTPTLTLNDGGTATYSGGSGSSALIFSYTVAAGQNTSDLTVTAYNANGGTITNGAGTAATMTGAMTNPTGALQIDTTTPAVPSVTSIAAAGSGKIRSGYTSADQLVLKGTAVANSTVEVFDGSNELGTATANGSGVWSYTTSTLANGTQSFTVKDLDAAGNVSPASTAMSMTVVTLAQVSRRGNTFDISTTAVDPPLNYNGAPFIVGEAGSWTPIAAVQITTGYEIAWTLPGTNEYTIWNTDSNGNYISDTVGVVSGTSPVLENAELIFQQDLNGDGVIGSNATTILVEVGNGYNFNNSAGSGPALNYQGSPFVIGEAGSWTPIAAVQTTTGYEIAWTLPGTNEYTIWNTDSNGNYISNTVGVVSGTSTVLENAELTFQQDLNGDGVLGPTTTIISSNPTTIFAQVGNEYYLNNDAGSGPALNYQGSPFVIGEAGSWTPIAAVQTTTGYEIAWALPGTNEYTIWNTDNSGNYISDTVGVVSGTSTVLENAELIFQQDLNGDGAIGSNATTSLVEAGNGYYFGSSAGLGPALNYQGSPFVIGEAGSWTPFAAAQTATGYEIAWSLPGTNEYTIWNTDSNGNYISDTIGVVSGTSAALENAELTFQQDLNGDGFIGSPTSVIAVTGDTLLSIGTVAQAATIAAGATLQLTGGDTSSVTFNASTGDLILDQSSQFQAQIDGFTGNGTLSGSDQIDLKNINYTAASESYSNGVLTVTDGTDTAKLDFNGSYVLANFSLASDGHGGTIVYDPPVISSNDTSGFQHPAPINLGRNSILTAAFAPQSTLGYLPDSNTDSTVSPGNLPQSANIALLGHYIASSFPTPSASAAGAMLGESAGELASHPMLANSQHA